MNKYHDQEYLKKVVKAIKKEPNLKAVMKQLKDGYESAKYEQDKISSFTAPEEVNRRNQAVYYYEDLFEMLKGNE